MKTVNAKWEILLFWEFIVYIMKDIGIKAYLLLMMYGAFAASVRYYRQQELHLLSGFLYGTIVYFVFAMILSLIVYLIMFNKIRRRISLFSTFEERRKIFEDAVRWPRK